MGVTAVKGYTDVIGKHGLSIYDVTGPTSYTTWSAPSTGGQQFLTPAQFGLRNFDFVQAVGFTVSGLYCVEAKLTAGNGGNLSKFILIWYPIATIGTTQATSLANLSAETIRLLIVGG